MPNTIVAYDYYGTPLSLDVDWAKEPLLVATYPATSNANTRCSSLNPDLPALRKEAVKRVTRAFDELLLLRGFAKISGATWSKPLPPVPIVQQPLQWFGDLLGWLAATSKLNSATQRNPARRALQLQVQKSKYGNGLFVNVHFLSGHQQDDVFRLQYFMAELHPTHRLDEFMYVRLVDDARYMRLFLAIVEHRIVPWFELAEKAGRYAPTKVRRR